MNQTYTCPMHPEVRQNSPGRCPECGMNLVPEKKDKESKKKDKTVDKHTGHTTQMFLVKFWVSLALTIIVVVYSDLPSKLFGWQAPKFFGSDYILLVLGSVVFFYGGWVFITSSYRELKGRQPGMMTLIALAITTAYFYSSFVTFTGKGQTLFWELTTLITVMLLGHWLEMRAVSGAQSALKELSKLIPDRAEVIRGYKTEIIPVDQLKIRDIVLVKPGARIPADGKVIEGQSEVNESMITGESRLVPKKKDNQVIAGTINGDGSLKVEVNKIGEETFLAGVMRLVREAEASKSKLQILSDKAAFYLTIIAILAGILTFVLWFLARAGVGFALERLVAVLVIACPHALGLAIPLVASISTTMAARNGFLIRQRIALEQARMINMVLFDKTGTLTKGKYGVKKIWSFSELDDKKILQLSASVDSHSEHPIAKALVREAKNRQIELLKISNFQRIPGKGASGQIAGQKVLVGGSSILKENQKGILIHNDEIKSASLRGETIIFLKMNEKLVGVISFADIIRSESKKAILDLKRMGLKVSMVTGDSQDVANWVSKQLKIDQTFARVLPQNKAKKVKILQNQGYKVAMVGDGINDAPALTQADLGIAIGAGTNVAIESAGIILARNDPRDIPKIIKLSRLTYSKMLANLFWATGYNVVAMPIAAGALAFKGIILQPTLAALLMSMSTIIVVFNAVLLKRAQLNQNSLSLERT